MHLHEYQAKMILQEYGIPMTDFVVISDVEEVGYAIKKLGVWQAVLKVQVHAGGRGKAGGVKIAKNPQEIISFAKSLLGKHIINAQTGKEGVIAHQVLLTPLVDYTKEFYIAMTIDRQRAKPIMILSPEGGTEIEEVAEKMPNRLLIIPFENSGKLYNYQLIEACKFMGWQGKTAIQGKELLKNLAKAFLANDAELLEINPLVETWEENLIALDVKMTIDDNALYRQQRIAAYYDPTQVSPHEVRARESDLAYISLDGEIGCMVNGAGLAMATMDIIHHYGGKPANFLDVGGSASEDKIAEGFKIVLSDTKVKAILVNIFGGIMNCVTLAAGIVAAGTQLEVHVPLVIRMEGTNVENGKKILNDSGLNILIADTLADAAEKVVKSATSQ